MNVTGWSTTGRTLTFKLKLLTFTFTWQCVNSSTTNGFLNKLFGEIISLSIHLCLLTHNISSRRDRETTASKLHVNDGLSIAFLR